MPSTHPNTTIFTEQEVQSETVVLIRRLEGVGVPLAPVRLFVCLEFGKKTFASILNDRRRFCKFGEFVVSLLGELTLINLTFIDTIN